MSHRAKPFSGKKKKVQLQLKRKTKKDEEKESFKIPESIRDTEFSLKNQISSKLNSSDRGRQKIK